MTDRERFEKWWVAHIGEFTIRAFDKELAKEAWQEATLAERERCLKICEDSNCRCYEKIRGE